MQVEYVVRAVAYGLLRDLDHHTGFAYDHLLELTDLDVEYGWLATFRNVQVATESGEDGYRRNCTFELHSLEHLLQDQSRFDRLELKIGYDPGEQNLELWGCDQVLELNPLVVTTGVRRIPVQIAVVVYYSLEQLDLLILLERFFYLVLRDWQEACLLLIKNLFNSILNHLLKFCGVVHS